MQEAGQAIYLVARRGSELADRCTVLTASKYDEVRRLLGAFPRNECSGGPATRSGHRNEDRRLC